MGIRFFPIKNVRCFIKLMKIILIVDVRTCVTQELVSYADSSVITSASRNPIWISNRSLKLKENSVKLKVNSEIKF